MAEHRITSRVPSHEVVNTDLVIEVRANDELLGELLASRGSIDWRPGRSQFVYRLGWEQFDDLMRAKARKVRKP